MSRQTGTLGGGEIRGVDDGFMRRVFYVFAGLALASGLIMLAGRWFGHAIALGGYSEDAAVHEIVIGNNVLAVPSNAIRFEKARRDGVADRLELYLRWPDMTGYTSAARDDFNGVGPVKSILFLTFENRIMSRDMSGRFDPIYRLLIVEPGQTDSDGVTLYRFKENAGYLDEMLAVAPRPGTTPFVARCLTGTMAAESMAPCERDIQVGNDLTLLYRFPRELLGKWQALDVAVTAKARHYLKTGG